MIKKVLFTLTLATMMAAQVKAQSINPCATDEMHRKQLALHPEIALAEAQLKKELDEKLTKTDFSKLAKTTADDGTTTYYVPLVFHIIHDYGTEYVSDAAIVNCVKKINEMYNKQNADTSQVIVPFKGFIPNSKTPYIGTARIIWQLPTKDPMGNPTNGVTRRSNYLTKYGSDFAKYDQWPPENYMNIWIINRFKDKPGTAAYAYKPATAGTIPYYDGPIGLFTYLNENDYTYSHELGHELNLDHTWGGTNEPNVSCGDDDVDDTPPTKGHSNCSGTVVAGNPAPALYDTACLFTKLAIMKDKLDILGYNVDTSTVKGMTFKCRTSSKIDSLTYYPSAPIGSVYQIGLFKNNVLIASKFDTSKVIDKAQGVRTNFSFLGADTFSTFKLAFITNPGAWRDSTTASSLTYSRGQNGTILFKTFSEDNYYNFFYNINIVFGFYKVYVGDSLVDYPDTTNSQNVMDYSFCAHMFTHGQTARMRAALTSTVANRSNLISPANLIRTGTGPSVTPAVLTPKAEYSVEKGEKPTGSGTIPALEASYFLCADIDPTSSPYSFVFQNRTWQSNATSVKWTLSNAATVGATSTSTTKVTTKFATPGWATVKIEATNANGTTEFTTQPNVYVADPTSTNPIGFWQEFTDNTENAKWPIFNYYNNRFKWETVNAGGAYDGTSMRYRTFDDRTFPENLLGEAGGDYDDFFSPAFDLSKLGAVNGNLNFLYAGAYATTNPTLMKDIFEIAYSTDCGGSWTNLKIMKDAELQTVGTVPAMDREYTPAWNEWKPMSIDLKSGTTTIRNARVFFRFRYKPSSRPSGASSGNNFYIDRINISDNPLTVNEMILGNKKVAVAPNPTNTNSYVLFSKPNANVSVKVMDITGKLVYSVSTKIDANNAKIEIPAANLGAKGVYLVHIVGDDNLVQTEKLVVY